MLEARRTEHKEMGKAEPMMPHKVKMAPERKPTPQTKTLPTIPQPRTQWNPTLKRTLTPTASCMQCTAILSTKVMAGILTGALPMTQFGKPDTTQWWQTHTNSICHPKER
jgi:hypothetical protein